MSENEDGADADDVSATPARRYGLILLVGVLVVAALFAYVLVGPGVGGEQGAPSGDDVGPTTAPATEEPPDTTAAGTSKATPAADFSFVIDRIQQCGQRCRDVTVTLTNTGQSTASNVRVTTRIFAGDHKVWQGQSDVGTVDAGESVTRTRRVNIGYIDAARIKSNDGYIRVETTIRWDGGSTTFSDRRKVA
jgi:hypothetical protein